MDFSFRNYHGHSCCFLYTPICNNAFLPLKKIKSNCQVHWARNSVLSLGGSKVLRSCTEWNIWRGTFSIHSTMVITELPVCFLGHRCSASLPRCGAEESRCGLELQGHAPQGPSLRRGLPSSATELCHGLPLSMSAGTCVHTDHWSSRYFNVKQLKECTLTPDNLSEMSPLPTDRPELCDPRKVT